MLVSEASPTRLPLVGARYCDTRTLAAHEIRGRPKPTKQENLVISTHLFDLTGVVGCLCKRPSTHRWKASSRSAPWRDFPLGCLMRSAGKPSRRRQEGATTVPVLRILDACRNAQEAFGRDRRHGHSERTYRGILHSCAQPQRIFPGSWMGSRSQGKRLYGGRLQVAPELGGAEGANRKNQQADFTPH